MWALLQLADSAFPMGGFAHSGGLEAAAPRDLETFVREAIAQHGRGVLPIVAAAHDDPSRHDELDASCDALLWSHVARRASTSQGRSLADVAQRAFNVTIRATHVAVVFGGVARALHIERRETLVASLHLCTRGLLSAAIRLNRIGPAAAQAMHARLQPELDAALAIGEATHVDDIATLFPIPEIQQATHDRLYSKLFQS